MTKKEGEAFIPNPETHPIVNHINRDKTDNSVGNLEWCDVQYNVTHKLDNLYNDRELFNQLCDKCK